MKKVQLLNMGVPKWALDEAISTIRSLSAADLNKTGIRHRLRDILADPAAWQDDPDAGELARVLLAGPPEPETGPADEPRAEPVPWRQWGTDIEEGAIEQMRAACYLPVAVAGALMPDAHHGYGLPIGGVLATDNAVVPYAVGVDIACRMKLTILDMPAKALERRREPLSKALEDETRFGIGAHFKDRRQHEVLDADWSVSPITERLRDKAWSQLGTSGSGNHFVEFGSITLDQPDLGLEPGVYLAVLSHSGSRGVGAAVCSHYSKIARELHPNLPKNLQHLAWLGLDTEEGQEYWAAMQLMGRYAEANHACIHRHIAKHLGAHVIYDLENHHNFAWIEEHGGRQVVVHRKGATPAGQGVMGIIPGSMASPGFVVRGKGDPASLASASHGAGRAMSRTKAHQTFRWNHVKPLLEERQVTLISAGLDEVPGVYKDIHSVMAAQTDLVDTVARFDPRIVKMAPAGEKPED